MTGTSGHIDPLERQSRRKVTVIHTSAVVEDIFRRLESAFPSLDLDHQTVPALFDSATSEPGLEFDRCILSLRQRVRTAEISGADAVLVTCSTLGPATDVVDAISHLPVVRIDRPMADEAARQADRIGLIATLESNFSASMGVLEAAARKAGKTVEITPLLRAEAFEALKNKNPALHDRLIQEGIEDLAGEVDLIVLAQASMSSAAITHPRVAVLTSPQEALAYLGRVKLEGGSQKGAPAPTNVDQLRIYRIRKGLMDMWIEYFHEVIVPLHEAVGIPVSHSWRNSADEDEFVWIRSFKDGASVEEGERRFFDSPGRAALADVRGRYVEQMTVRLLGAA